MDAFSSGRRPGSASLRRRASLALIWAFALAAPTALPAVAAAQENPEGCAIVAGQHCAVDLSGAYNHDGTATVSNPGQGNFDGLGWSYDAALLPPAGPFVLAGITYNAPDPTGTALNFVEARGQTLSMPQREYSHLRLIFAAHNGPVNTTFTVRYSDGTSTAVPVAVGDWAGSAASGSTVALDMPHRIRAGQGVDGPSVRLFARLISLDATKEIEGLSLPNDARVEIYAITLSEPTPPPVICNIHCDGRDPDLAAGDRVGGTTTAGGREIVLRFSDADNMAWAEIAGGEAGDQVWLDRSFDGARTWDPDGSMLGRTTLGAGEQNGRTPMFNVDDPDERQIGAMRACGRPAGAAQATCTPWARSTVNAETPVDAAATALMQFYNQTRGLWDTTGWWNSGNALTALIDYSDRTGSQAYRYAIAMTFERNQSTNFINEYIDDTGWWGLAWIRAYDLTGEQRYLDMAKVTADYMHSYWDDHCGGGVWWRTDMTYKNAVSNELYIKLTAALHNRIPGDTTYLARAQAGWDWFLATGMINAQNLINDGLNASCQNNGQPTWTYNQGIILGGLVELHEATGDPELLVKAQQIADAATTSSSLNPGGVLREPCEPNCGLDGPSFKGIFVRNLGELDRYLPESRYHDYLVAQADAAYANNRNALDQYGLRWAGPFDFADAARQHVALDLLTAALEEEDPGEGPAPVTPPTLSGTGKHGTMLTCNPGTWSEHGSDQFTWLRDGDPVAVGMDPGQTGSTNPKRYRADAAHAGAEVVCQVARTGASGTSAPAGSNAVTLLALDVPENTEAPTLAGSGRVGTMLTCDRGEWTGTGAYTYTWLLDGDEIEAGTGGGQTGSTNPARYRAKVDEVGLDVVCRVTRTSNNGTSGPADSNAVTIDDD